MKTKIILAILLIFGSPWISSGQVSGTEKNLRTLSADTTLGWRKGGVFAVNLSQTSLTNWAAGGQNSMAINGIFSAFANYKRNKSVWDNSLDLGYGLLKQGKKSDFMKTDDKIDFLSKYGREAFKNFYYAALLNFNTHLLYDDNTKINVDRNNDGIMDLVPSSRVQFKEILGVGFSYKF